jgi:hypothetical protein
VLGGDFNFRQADAIDHLLIRGARFAEPPRALPHEARELVCSDGRRLRLSDHAPIVARIAER